MLVMEVGLVCVLMADDEDQGRMNVYALLSPPPARSTTFLKCLSCLEDKRCPWVQMCLKGN